MASLRLTFPEKEQPTVIALTGARLTIGRLPFNTIQIIDRTVSGFHAELISEHGHYRLHDRGSSNGTFVNGEKIADFHLNEACTITFGTVEAEFSPEATAAGEEVEDFPTRTEINGVRQENAELKATVAVLREEAEALRLARPLENGDVALVVTKEEYDKVVVERESLKEARLKQDEEIARFKTDLAVLKRDRVNLQLAYDSVQRELADVRAQASGEEEVALLPKAAATALAAQAPATPHQEVRVAVPARAVPSTTKIAPIAAPAAPASAPEPASAPASPSSFPKPPTATPQLPKAPSVPGVAMKPFSPLPKAPGVAAPAPQESAVAATAVPRPVGTPIAAPAGQMKAPIGLGSGIRPMARPPTAVAAPAQAPESGPKTTPLPNVQTARLAPRPLPTMKLPAQPTVKLSPVPAPAAGPKGTQKL